MKRTATAVWNGSGKEGSGKISAQSSVLNNASYTWKSRFEDGIGTNPEELVAAAHAACFSMKLSFVLGAAGFVPEMIETACTTNLENGAIVNSHLAVKAKAGAITKEKFEECAQDAKANCPISKSLNTNITMEPSLV